MKNKKHGSTNPFLIYLAILLLAGNMVFLGALFSTEDHATATQASPTATALQTPTLKPSPAITSIASPSPIRLAWFTSLPKNADDILTVAEWFDLFILIRGDDGNRDLVKSLGVDGPILQYVEFETIQDPGSCDAEPKINQVADRIGDFCRISQDQPDWFLLDQNRRRIKITDNDNTWYVMDPGNPGWRDFFLERVREFQSDPNWDGVFLDNVPVTLAFREDDDHLPAAYPDDAGYREAVQGFLKHLHEGYFKPNHKLLIANLVSRKDDSTWTDQLSYIDGAMFEGWAIDWPDGYRPPQVWEEHMRAAEQTQQAGKYIILVSQGRQEDLAMQLFAFASYLLINQGKAAFRYANSSQYREIWLYDNYRDNLGNPLGSYYKLGEAWRRDFSNGYVMVNPVTHKAEISVK